MCGTTSTGLRNRASVLGLVVVARRLIIDHTRGALYQVLTSREVLAVHKMDEEHAAMLPDLRRGVRRRV